MLRLRNLRQNGFHLIGIAVALLVVGIIGLAGWKVTQQAKNGDSRSSETALSSNGQTKEKSVQWAFDERKLAWYAKTGTPTRCADPFIFKQSPVDLSKIQVIGMPGAYRGYNYKPHGGLRLLDPQSGAIEVRMPADATLVGINRYYEGSPPDLQYLLTFETDCGIAFRFDHLYSLAPAFQRLAETTPEPKLNDTRTDPNRPFARTTFKAGEVVATAVGLPKLNNYGFDFGAYDYRHRNTISKNAEWARLHNQYQSLDWFGTCWINQLPAADAVTAKQLALTVINPARPNLVSDYCSFAPQTTLDINDGKPTDG